MEIGIDSPYHWTNLVAQMTSQNKPENKQNRKDRRKEKKNTYIQHTKDKNTDNTQAINHTTNSNNEISIDSSISKLLSSLLPTNKSPGISSITDTEESIKIKIANLVLHKLGITDEKFKKYINDEEGLEVTSMVQDLLNGVSMKTKGSKLYDFLIVVQYEGGSYGYIEYTGTYSDAKKHSLRCLAKEFGQDMFLEKDTLISSHPIYTVGHQHVKCTVIPHIKGIWSS